ncbi:MAG: 30S ribosomal protein S5 alanine N-acetyltransferase [Leptolyngbya sp.]|nr:MAG: 30S ribosomal protein S5 alanine N-acetyltransferase [Leptolyngbya sp.]
MLSEWQEIGYLKLPILTTERLILRLATNEDIPAILNFYLENRDFLTPYEPTRSEDFYTFSFWRDQVEKALIEFNYNQAIKFCIFKRTEPTILIGKINFHQILRGVCQSCVLGYSLAETEQDNGYMTEALKTAIHFIFADLNFHRIAANYMPRNQRSANVLKRLGFTVEGYARDYLLINGQWEDHILSSLIHSNWSLQEIEG